MTPISRRRFIGLTGGLIATGCSSGAATNSGDSERPDGGTQPTTSEPTRTTTSVPGATVTTVTTPPELVADDHVLVVVELNGGNDAINTLIPDLGSYRDVRPTIAIPESEILRVDALPGHGLHPSLAPLVPLFDAGRIAAIAGVGFPEPDRSHFTSTDRWRRADRMDETLGWLGRWFDSLDVDIPALGATALGGTAAIFEAATIRASAISNTDSFALPSGVSNADIRALAATMSNEPLAALAQQAYGATVGAVEEFDVIADAVRSQLDPADPTDSFSPVVGPFSTGLAVAAELIKSDAGTRAVSVIGNGFDTHNAQLSQHADLLSDLASGLSGFWAAVEASGDADRVVVVTTSEFGRRVAENGSAGCDHGAAGVSLLMGHNVAPGLFGSVDTDRPLDGDLRSDFDPRTVYTACLDWLGGDVERILGTRYDELQLLI